MSCKKAFSLISIYGNFHKNIPPVPASSQPIHPEYLSTWSDKDTGFFQFSKQIFWASFVSLLAFVSFALTGGALFERVFQVRFASFQIFGGITFLIMCIRLILGMGPPMEALRTDSSQLSGATAMPFIVGPDTISASVLAGIRLDPLFACLCIGLALSVAILAILLFKFIYDHALSRNDTYLQRYIGIAGRVTALFTGSFSIELIFKGIEG